MHGVGHKMKEVWSADKQRDSRDFKNDQILNSELVFLIIHVSIQISCIETGRKTNRWNSITIRMGMCVCIHVHVHIYFSQLIMYTVV